MSKYQVISTDSHTDVPFGELAKRAPKEFREKIDRVRLFEDDPDSEVARKAKRRRERMMAQMNEEDLERIRHGGWDPALRVKDQDQEGILGGVMSWTWPASAQFAHSACRVRATAAADVNIHASHPQPVAQEIF